MTDKSLRKLKPVIVVIPKVLLRRIDKAAKQAGMNRSALMRLAVDRYITEQARG